MTNITKSDDISDIEAMEYVRYLEEKYGRKLETLDITSDGEFVDLNYKFTAVPFERIRRITGYLVGDMSHWNDGKTAEERDRVKHLDMNEQRKLEVLLP